MYLTIIVNFPFMILSKLVLKKTFNFSKSNIKASVLTLFTKPPIYKAFKISFLYTKKAICLFYNGLKKRKRKNVFKYLFIFIFLF